MAFNFDPNPLFFTMARLFSEKSADSKLIIGNEGSSRSSKTYDAFHFLVAFCEQNQGNPMEIYILRDTLVNCRDFTLNEFKRCLGTFLDEEGVERGIGIWDEDNFIGSPKPVYKLFGHKIKFRGTDETDEGYPSDVLFFNEVLDCNEMAVKNLIMRCRQLVIMDWNPKYTLHWVFEMEKRTDTVFTKTTYKNNRFAPKAFIKEVEAYSPWMMEDMEKPVAERRPHEENIRNGTADLFKWKVYGLGERANKEGLVFPNVTWVDRFPTKEITLDGQKLVVDDVDEVAYGMDFGKTHQTAIVKIGYKHGEHKSKLYLEKLFYMPTENSKLIAEVLIKLGLKDEVIWCDNNQPMWVSDLINNYGIKAMTTNKFPGSRDYWIATIKRFDIHLIKSQEFRKEQENFSYRVVGGIQLPETIKEHDHLWSASGYGTVGAFRFQEEQIGD